jgi:hypothetical protein
MVYATQTIVQSVGTTQAQNAVVVGYITNLNLPAGAVVISAVNYVAGGSLNYDGGQYNIAEGKIFYVPTMSQQNVTCTYRVLFMIP